MNRWICCALFGCMGFAMCHMEAQNTTMEGERQHASGSTVDVLTLTNGMTLLGEVTEENGEYVRFNDLSGKLNKLIYKEQIKEIGTTTVSGKQLKALTGKRQKRTVRPNPILRGQLRWGCGGKYRHRVGFRRWRYGYLWFALRYGAGFYGQLKGGLEFNNRFKLSVGLCLDTHPSWETEYYHDHEVYRSATVAGAQFQASFGYCF